jgi:hypothetical protein
MMNHSDRWMGGWGGGGMWFWTPVCLLVLFLLVVAITKVTKK